MKKTDLIRTLQISFKHLRVQDAGAVVQCITDAIAGGLAEGNRVEIRGFGSFMPTIRSGRETVNPRNGEQMFVPPVRGVIFRAGGNLKKGI
ncbi:MAG: integration host factor subunit beta [Rickettsiales bacterium]|jgi:integration host factor subunit beta|nr:integration host factor subunit beta [Rickettsiales bacterium]